MPNSALNSTYVYIDAIFTILDRFIDGAKIDDDITAVVIKIEASSLDSSSCEIVR